MQSAPYTLEKEWMCALWVLIIAMNLHNQINSLILLTFSCSCINTTLSKTKMNMRHEIRFFKKREKSKKNNIAIQGASAELVEKTAPILLNNSVLPGCLKYSARLIRADQCTLTSPEGWKVCSDYVSLKIYLTMGIRCPWNNDPGKHFKFSFYSCHPQCIINAIDTITITQARSSWCAVYAWEGGIN